MTNQPAPTDSPDWDAAFAAARTAIYADAPARIPTATDVHAGSIDVWDQGEWVGPVNPVDRGRSHVIILVNGWPAAWANSDTRPHRP